MFSKILSYVSGVVQEFRNITWAENKLVLKTIQMVAIVSVFLMAFMFVIDLLLGKVIYTYII